MAGAREPEFMGWIDAATLQDSCSRGIVAARTRAPVIDAKPVIFVGPARLLEADGRCEANDSTHPNMTTAIPTAISVTMSSAVEATKPAPVTK